MFYSKVQFVPRSKHSPYGYKAHNLMLYVEIMAVCSEILTKYINTLCGKNVKFFNVNLRDT
jgi:hypothetical protein